LRPEDGEALLSCELWESDYRKHGISDPNLTAWWAIAAVELQNDKDKAREILLQANARFQGRFQGVERGELASALWRLAGAKETEYLVTWFYGEKPPYHLFPHQRVKFLTGVSKHRNEESRKFLADLITHKEFETIDWQSLKKLVTIVNAWSDKPVVNSTLIEAARHPSGEEHYDRDVEKAKKDYPKESENLQQTLSQWRLALSAAVSQWNE
jgi:hypothetical protein